MKALVPFSIPVKGLRDGIHQFEFRVGRSFFECFESSPVEDGQIQVQLEFEKRPGLYVLQFELDGAVRTECDRCLESIELPVASQQRLLVKFSEEAEKEEDADVVYISMDTPVLNVAQFVYEFIILALPMIKVYDCENDENARCNPDMLKFLEGEPKEKEEKDPNPIWDALKDFNVDN